MKIRWRHRPQNKGQLLQQKAGDPTWGFAFLYINWNYPEDDFTVEQIQRLKSLDDELEIEEVA